MNGQLHKRISQGGNIFHYAYLDPLTQKPVVLTLEKIYTDKAGNDFYSFQNPLQMTAERILALEVIQKSNEYSIDTKTLIELMDLIIDNCNKGKPASAAMVAGDVKIRAMKICDYELVMDFASIAFLINDERPDLLIPGEKEKKLKLWKEDAESRSFFLLKALQRLQLYNNLSPETLRNYLTELIPADSLPVKEISRKSSGRYNIKGLSKA